MEFEKLLRLMVEKGGSDLFITAGVPPSMKVNGKVLPVTKNALTPEQTREFVYGAMNEKQRAEFEETHECNFAISARGIGRFRVSAFFQRNLCGMVLRRIEVKIPQIDDLALPNVIKDLAMTKRGLIMFVGATGTGKSTSLAAMLGHRNRNSRGHIISIEDPIEFVHESKKCLVNQREVHRDTLGFNEALRSALREDPDIILVGELRDLETIRLALTAAETGHLVFGTLHTTSAAKTIDRVVDVFPAEEKSMVRSMLSESLQAVVSQTLMKKMGGGRIAAHEIMIGTSAIRNLIREDKIAQMYSSIQTGGSLGMQTLDQCLERLLQKGLISREAARAKAKMPDNF
jgi:twitching motility protein PilT